MTPKTGAFVEKYLENPLLCCGEAVKGRARTTFYQYPIMLALLMPPFWLKVT